ACVGGDAGRQAAIQNLGLWQTISRWGLVIKKQLVVCLCALDVLTVLAAGAQLRYGTDQDDRVSEQIVSARSKQHAGDYHAARDILLQTLSEAPDSASLLDALGSVEQDLGEYFEAERSYLRALSLSAATSGDPERVAILQNLATLYIETHQYPKGE